MTVFYARQDTMYLTYLYTRLRNTLISKGNAKSNLLHACVQSNDMVEEVPQAMRDGGH